MFSHINFDTYEKADKPTLVYNGRRSHYEYNGKVMQRITSILSKMLDSEGLSAWRERVGEEVANHICKTAIARGNALHTLAEKYLKNDLKVGEFGDALLPLAMFEKLRPFLDRISNIRGIEIPVVSEKYQVAGTIDIVAEYDGVLSIIDLKSSTRPKKPEWCERYYLQECFYALALEEMTGQPISTLITLVVSENGQVQVLKEDRDSWIHRLDSIIDSYMKLYPGVCN